MTIRLKRNLKKHCKQYVRDSLAGAFQQVKEAWKCFDWYCDEKEVNDLVSAYGHAKEAVEELERAVKELENNSLDAKPQQTLPPNTIKLFPLSAVN